MLTDDLDATSIDFVDIIFLLKADSNRTHRRRWLRNLIEMPAGVSPVGY